MSEKLHSVWPVLTLDGVGECIGDARPIFVVSCDGRHLLFANAAGARFLALAPAAALEARIRLEPRVADRLARFAAGSRLGDTSRELIRFFDGLRSSLLSVGFRRVLDDAVLITVDNARIEPADADPAASLAAIAAEGGLVALFDGDGEVVVALGDHSVLDGVQDEIEAALDAEDGAAVFTRTVETDDRLHDLAMIRLGGGDHPRRLLRVGPPRPRAQTRPANEPVVPVAPPTEAAVAPVDAPAPLAEEIAPHTAEPTAERSVAARPTTPEPPELPAPEIPAPLLTPNTVAEDLALAVALVTETPAPRRTITDAADVDEAAPAAEPEATDVEDAFFDLPLAALAVTEPDEAEQPADAGPIDAPVEDGGAAFAAFTAPDAPLATPALPMVVEPIDAPATAPAIGETEIAESVGLDQPAEPTETESGPIETPVAEEAPAADLAAPADATLADIAAAPAVETPTAEAADVSESVEAEEADGDGFRYRLIDRAVKFVWQMDAERRFTLLSGELAEVIGPRAAAVVGRSWGEVAADLGLDPEGRVAAALDRRDTWSGRTVLWPVEGEALRLPVDLAALPAFDRGRVFAGYRGFGTVRGDEAVPDPTATGLRLAAAPQQNDAAPVEATAAVPPIEPVAEPAAPIALLAPVATAPDAVAPHDGAPIVEIPSIEADVEPPSYPDDSEATLHEERHPAHDLDTLEDGEAAFTGEIDPPAAPVAEPAPAPIASPTLPALWLDDELALALATLPACGETFATVDDEPIAAAPTPADDTIEAEAVPPAPVVVPSFLIEAPVSPLALEAEERNLADEADAGTEVALDAVADVPPTTPAVRPSAFDFADVANEDEAGPGAATSPVEPTIGGEADPLAEAVSIAEAEPIADADAPETAAFHLGEAATPPPQPTATLLPTEPVETEGHESVTPAETAEAEEVEVATLADLADEAATLAATPIPPAAGREPSPESEASPTAHPLPPASPAASSATTDDTATPPIAPTALVAPIAAAANVVALGGAVRAPSEATALSQPERVAFRQIAEALGARIEGDDLPRAAAKPTPAATAGSTSAPTATAVAPAAVDTRLLDRLPAAVAVVKDDDLVYGNDAFLRLLGYPDLAALQVEGGLDALFAGEHVARRWQPGPDGGRPVPVLTHDGRVLPVDATVATVPWNGASALMLTLVEVTATPHTEPNEPMIEAPVETAAPTPLVAPPTVETADDFAGSTLRTRVAELEAIIDTATDGVLMLDAEGTILSANHAAEALFGTDRHVMAGRSLADRLAPESRRSAMDYLDGLARNGVASVLNDGREVIGVVEQGGLIPLFMTIGRLSADPARKYCAVLRDITQWKKSEEDLTAARRRAEEASVHKSDFLAKISHEIRTPLNAIIGFSEVMMDERFGPIGNDRYKDYLRDIHSSGSHIMSLINDLLDLSKVEAGKMDLRFESVTLADIMSECVAMMQPQANRERIIIRSSLPAGVPPVVADPRSVRQVMLNLLSNAIKFTPSGGQVIVSSTLEDSGEVVMRVRDTGYGMTDKELQTAMEPFRQLHTTRSRGGGTGLGLPLTKALVEANRAVFRIDSTVGQGTLVTVTFPVTRVLAS